jgi:glycine/sarcosine N-methyltransferase
MSSEDKYQEIAELYDAMLPADAAREEFFRYHFQRYNVKRILDCACGTGNDLLLFQKLGYTVCGSDLSGAMLAVAKRKLLENNMQIPLQQIDFHHLEQHYSSKFGAVVCLSNAINEFEVDPRKALRSMRSMLSPGGIIVFDQGQTDFSMKNPPLYVPIVNNKDISRLFVMDYGQSLMTVRAFDFVHKEEDNRYDFRCSEFKIRIRLLADWKEILDDLELEAEYYGDWDSVEYDLARSKRLITIARIKEESSQQHAGDNIKHA